MKTLSPEVLLMVSLGIGLVPILISVGTCYLKFSIVLSLLRSGFGTQQAPSASMVMALSMVMSLVVMQPVVHGTMERMKDIKVTEISGASVGTILKHANGVALPWREFMTKHTGERERETFARFSSRDEVAAEKSDVGLAHQLGAFVLSEVKKGFLIGFILLVPFFVIDVIVANVLVALGLTMMSPSTVSLPLKLLLFVSSDGWLLLAKSLIAAYQ
jgi:type III secretion protein R